MYTIFLIFSLKEKKIWYVIFLCKVITVFFREKEKIEYRNNNIYGKMANFQLVNIGKINYRMLVVILYISLRLRLKKIQLLKKVFKSFVLLLYNE